MNRLCYNSGKISGLSEEYVANKFSKAADRIKRIGLIPVNPPTGLCLSWTAYMVLDIILLAFCHYIYMQKDWTTSRGAIIEHKWAKRLGKKMLYER